MNNGATSFKDTSFGIISRNRLLKLEIEGTKRGLEFLMEQFKVNTVLEITPGLIRKLHQKSFGWIFPKWAGKFRRLQVSYSGKEVPPYYQIPELIINLCGDFRERFKHLPKFKDKNFIDKVIQLLAWWQHRFVVIHPFNDYNGRTARMLTVLILLKLNLPAMEIKAGTSKDRKSYIKAMRMADTGDYSLLEKLLTEALTEALKKYNEL